MPDSLPDNKTNKKRQTEADRETGQAASQTHRQKQSDQNKQNKEPDIGRIVYICDAPSQELPFDDVIADFHHRFVPAIDAGQEIAAVIGF